MSNKYTKLLEFFGARTDKKPSTPDPVKIHKNLVRTTYGPGGLASTEIVEFYPSTPDTVKKSKVKFAHYDSTACRLRYPNEPKNRFKVQHITDRDGLVTVKAHLVSEYGSELVAKVSGTSDLTLNIEVGEEKITLGAHEAHDLALALMKYHELKGYARFTKVEKEKKNV